MGKQVKVRQLRVTRDILSSASFASLDDDSRAILRQSSNPSVRALADEDPRKARNATLALATSYYKVK